MPEHEEDSIHGILQLKIDGDTAYLSGCLGWIDYCQAWTAAIENSEQISLT